MRFIPRRRLNESNYQTEWDELQKDCANRKTWPLAVSKADKLVDKALKQKGYKGHSTGEKLVAAQHDLSFNEEIWFSHKYAKKLSEGELDVRKLKKKEMLMALAGFREALRDLGALKKRPKNDDK
jgi:hypothetical protein